MDLVVVSGVIKVLEILFLLNVFIWDHIRDLHLFSVVKSWLRSSFKLLFLNYFLAFIRMVGSKILKKVINALLEKVFHVIIMVIGRRLWRFWLLFVLLDCAEVLIREFLWKKLWSEWVFSVRRLLDILFMIRLGENQRFLILGDHALHVRITSGNLTL